MADNVDIANELDDFLLGLALKRQALKVHSHSAQLCEDCDDPIPVARQLAAIGCETCIDCQDRRERRR